MSDNAGLTKATVIRKDLLTHTCFEGNSSSSGRPLLR